MLRGKLICAEPKEGVRVSGTMSVDGGPVMLRDATDLRHAARSTLQSGARTRHRPALCDAGAAKSKALHACRAGRSFWRAGTAEPEVLLANLRAQPSLLPRASGISRSTQGPGAPG